MKTKKGKIMQFAFKHMDRSSSIEKAAQDAFQGIIDKFTIAPTSFIVTFSVNKKFKSVHLSVHLTDGHQIELEQGEEDLYKAIDLIADRFEREIRRHKGKRLAQRHEDPNINYLTEEA